MFALVPVIACPAQFRVMPLLPMMRPEAGQGPIFAVRVVLVVIVWLHQAVPPGFAKAGAGRMTRVEPRTVKRSRMVSRIFGESLSLMTDNFARDGLFMA